MNLIVFKLNHLGDNIVFVPVIQALRRLRPDWRLTLLTTPNEAELYGGPWAPQEVLLSPKAAFDKSYRRPWELARWILRARNRRPDAALISFDQGTVAHFAAKLSGAPIRVGGNLEHVRIRNSVTREVPLPPDGRPVSWHWRMGFELLATTGGAGDWPAEPPPPNFDHLQAPVRPLTAGRKRIVVHAGASRPINQWDPAKFGAVAAALAADHEVVWIEHGATGSAPAGTLTERPDGLAPLAALLRSADLFLGNNSGPMHLANALGCPGIAVTGPSALGWNPYWHRERWTVLRHPSLPCAPCEVPNKALAGCANLNDPMACLRYWTPARVEVACRDRLAQPQEASP